MSPLTRVTWSIIALAMCLFGCDSADTVAAEAAEKRAAAIAGTLPISEAIEVSPEQAVDQLEGTFLDFCAISKSTLMLMSSRRDDPTYSCVGEGLYARFSTGSDNEVSTCETARDACFESSDPYTPPEPVACGEAELLEASSCAITIAEYEACIVGINETFEFIDSTLSCNATQDQAYELEALYTAASPEACDPIAENCPLLAALLP
tara:strand:+ start:375 stop:995 length:621 start_codon:yes stop_codon:yes gene_type:complete